MASSAISGSEVVADPADEMLRPLLLLGAAAGATGLCPSAQIARPAVGAHARAAVRMAGEAGRARRSALLEDVKAVMEPASLMFNVRTEGLQVNELNNLRMSLPEGVVMKCCKNTLVNLAAADYPQFDAPERADLLHYSNYWFFVPEDQMKDGIKSWKDWVKENKKDNEIVGGIFEGKILDKKGVEAVSKLPTKRDLMQKTALLLKGLPAKIAKGLKQADATRIARGIKQAQGTKLGRAVKAASEKMD